VFAGRADPVRGALARRMSWLIDRAVCCDLDGRRSVSTDPWQGRLACVLPWRPRRPGVAEVVRVHATGEGGRRTSEATRGEASRLPLPSTGGALDQIDARLGRTLNTACGALSVFHRPRTGLVCRVGVGRWWGCVSWEASRLPLQGRLRSFSLFPLPWAQGVSLPGAGAGRAALACLCGRGGGSGGCRAGRRLRPNAGGR
jgi:hypothetical protein